MHALNQSDSEKNDQQALPPKVFEQFIYVQGEEVKVRAEEAKNRKEEIELARHREDLNHKYATKQLDAQAKFLSSLPSERREDRKQLFIFLCVFLLVFVSIGVLAHFGDYMSQYFDLLKDIGVFLAGAATGAGGTYISIRSKEEKEDIIEE